MLDIVVSISEKFVIGIMYGQLYVQSVTMEKRKFDKIRENFSFDETIYIWFILAFNRQSSNNDDLRDYDEIMGDPLRGDLCQKSGRMTLFICIPHQKYIFLS